MSTSLLSRKKNTAAAAGSKGAPPVPKGAATGSKAPPTSLNTRGAPPPKPTEERPAKRVKRPAKNNSDSPVSEVYHQIGGLADMNITEDELRSWRAKTEEEKDAFILKASCELLVHNMDRDNNKELDRARLQELEVENETLKKAAKENDRRLLKLKSDRDIIAKELDAEKACLQERDASITDLKESLSRLTLENNGLKEDQANGWALEKEKLQDASFSEGVNCYVATFLAGHPDYDWTINFSNGLASWMAKFSEEERETIAEKKAELEEEKAKEAASVAQEARPVKDNVEAPVGDLA